MIHKLLRLLFSPIYLFLPPVYVFQMGKVGSSSVWVSILKHGYTHVFHVHSMEGASSYARFLFRIRKGLGLKVYIICPVREPLSRNVSAFFENFKRDTGLDYSEKPLEVDEVMNMFLNHYPHNVFTQWFDRYLKPATGIDIFTEPFPKEKKWSKYSNGNVKLLVYRVDMERDRQLDVISDFLDAKKLKWYIENTGSEKNYADLYNKVCISGKLPNTYMDEMCKSKTCKHFWTDEEIEFFKKKWSSTKLSC